MVERPPQGIAQYVESYLLRVCPTAEPDDDSYPPGEGLEVPGGAGEMEHPRTAPAAPPGG